MLVERWIRQETVDIRGKSTCYATSIVNTVIGLGAVTREEARRQHPAIINHLVAIPDLWNGAVQRIQTLVPRIAEIIEMYLPIRVSFDSEIGRLMLFSKSFDQI